MSEITENKLFKGFNNNQLKIIAMVSMALDHIGLIFFPYIKIWRILGRLAFPIYAYMIAEGCRYTQNRKKYLGTMALMAFVFQLVYLLFMKSVYQGILVNFSLSIGAIFAIESFIKNKNSFKRRFALSILCIILFIQIVCPVIFKEYGFAIDYGIWGFILPILVYFMPDKYSRAISVGILLIIMTWLSGKVIQWFSLLTIPLFLLYNEKRGSKKMKYVFYVFYPLHLVIIYAIAYLIIFLK